MSIISHIHHSNRYFLIGFFLLSFFGLIQAQTGPNSPLSGANNTSIGANAWINPTQILASDNTYATVSTKGITNYLSGTNFGFSISIPSSITGIVLEVERSTNTSTAVAVLNNWTTGLTKTISAGVSRCLVVAVFMENGLGPRDITALTYGGQSMTAITETVVGSASGFCGKVEYWRLLESGIAAATSTSFALTFNGTALLENWEAVSSAVFQFVDQSIPVSNFSNFISNTSANPITLSPALVTLEGGMSISGAFCGQNTTPASSVGGTNTYLINSGFTEVIDTYTANSGATSSGGAFQIANKATVTSGSEAPTYTFAGTPNRQLASCIHLQKIREVDNSVRLIKAGTITGNNYAQTTAAWPSTDTYTSYGSSTDLWGTTWTDANINANNFGAVLSASVQNGTARVDHMRITIYSFSTLPIELLNFYGENKNRVNHLYWQTASESNNKEFVVEKSQDAIQFVVLGKVNGKDNSNIVNHYELEDKNPNNGTTYYRLKQVDNNGTFKYHKLIAVNNQIEESEFYVYPNPSPNGLFNTVSSSTNQDDIFIYDVNLNLVKKISSNLKELQFSLEELADGIYFLLISSQEDQKIKRFEKVCKGF